MGKLLMNPTPNYAALFDASPYPYLLVGLDWNIIGANKSYLNAVGRTLQDILGLPLFEAFPPNPQDPDSTNDDIVRASIQRAIDTGEPDTTPFIRYAVPHQTATGVVFQPLYWSTVHTPVFNNDGKLEFVVQNAIDVTALYTFDDSAKTAQLQEQPKATFPDYSQAQAHQALMRILKSERSHLLELFNQAPGFIAVMRGPNYVFELANEAYYQLLGRREIIGKPVFEAFPDVAGQGFEELLDGVYKTGKPFLGRGIKFQVQKVAGGPFTELYIDLLYQPFFAPDGVTVTGIFAQGQDVTDIHQANLALQEADRRKDVFLSMLAHELRNPLAPISAAVEILGLSSSNPVQVINTSQVIRRQVKHMTGLVDDLLDVSRVTSGLVVLDNIAVNVDAVSKTPWNRCGLILTRGIKNILCCIPMPQRMSAATTSAWFRSWPICWAMHQSTPRNLERFLLKSGRTIKLSRSQSSTTASAWSKHLFRTCLIFFPREKETRTVPRVVWAWGFRWSRISWNCMAARSAPCRQELAWAVASPSPCPCLPPLSPIASPQPSMRRMQTMPRCGFCWLTITSTPSSRWLQSSTHWAIK